MIRLTLDDLLNHGRVGPLALGDPKSKIDAIEGLAAGLQGAYPAKDGTPLAAYYRFGDFEIHCGSWKAGDELEIDLFVLQLGHLKEGWDVDGDAVFDVESLGIRTGQDVDFVLSRLKDFSICRSSRRAPPEMQAYDVGRYGTALFIEEDDSTTWFTQFEVYDRMRRVTGGDG